MSSQKRICKDCGREFVPAPDEPGYVNVCPRCSGPPPLSNEDPRRIFLRKRMAELAKESGWSESEIEKMIDDQWLEDHGNEPTEKSK
jgi:predicted nucleic acid-binding Zn ribbon protein